jgi:serine/threonine protein kinase
MLTEEILFDIDIDTSDKNKRDIEHLAQMSKVLGNIPRDMAMSFSNIDELSFTINLKENINLRGKIQESVQIEENELDYLEDLMYKILEYDPEKRLSATEILQHKWFQV